MKKLIEKYTPVTLSILILILIFKFDESLIYNLSFNQISGTTLVVFSVLLGFLLTITTLLQTIRNRKMELLKATGLYSLLISYLKSAIYFSLFLFLSSLVYPFYKSSVISEIVSSNNLNVYLRYSFLYLLLHSVFTTIRFIYIFIRLVTERNKTIERKPFKIKKQS